MSETEAEKPPPYLWVATMGIGGPNMLELWACTVCGAPVVEPAKELHTQWHGLLRGLRDRVDALETQPNTYNPFRRIGETEPRLGTGGPC